jgi:ribonuclease HI
MLVKANDEGALTGVPTSKRGPRISHLFFADDSLLFCRSNIVQWDYLTNMLRLYEAASGQRLNGSKTSIFFSKNTSLEDKGAILGAAGIPSTQRYDTYLGLSALVGKSRIAAFKGIGDRVWKRLQDWKLKFLSQAGKEVLLKAVIQAIPTYSMNVFLLPRALCVEINKQMSKFWWSHQANNSRIHWMSWERMGLSKEVGGMGFRDLTSFNKALLAKQSWRLWSKLDSLVARIMEAKYYAGSSILEASIGRRPSFAWRSIHSSCDLLKEGLMWRVGNGCKIQIWKDKWIPRPHSFKIISPPVLLQPESTVNQLIDGDIKCWNRPLLARLFSVEEIEMILAIPISCTNQEDILIWRGTKNGLFSVRSAYHLHKELENNALASTSTSQPRSDFWKGLWALRVLNVEKNFLWRACQNILPTRGNLHKRKVISDPLCPVCGLEEETALHILWQCPSAMDVWAGGDIIFQKSAFTGTEFRQVVEYMMEKCNPDAMRQFVGMARRIWLRRNEYIHGSMLSHPKLIVEQTNRAILEFHMAHERDTQLSHGVRHPTCWTAPRMEWIKANWDAAVAKKMGHVGIGVVLRDSLGHMIRAESAMFVGGLDLAVAEAKAVLHAIHVCRAMGLSKVHFEGDAKIVVDSVNSGMMDTGWMGHLIADIKLEIQAFDEWQLSFIGREGNKVAHLLANYAVKNGGNSVWNSIPPDCIRETLLLESSAPVA